MPPIIDDAIRRARILVLIEKYPSGIARRALPAPPQPRVCNMSRVSPPVDRD